MSPEIKVERVPWRTGSVILRYYVCPDSGCHLWAGAKCHNGYGVAWLSFPRSTCRAHRVTYEVAKGPIPSGLVLDHLCRVKQCVNPSHLEPVTNATNQRRGAGAKLSFADIEEIRQLSAKGIFQREIARRFGVSQSLICRLLRGQRWRVA